MHVPFALPDITEAEVAAVTDVLRSGWLTTGSKCSQFEEKFAAEVAAAHAVALNSCTAALHLSLEAVGVRPGDLVFVPSYTFAATAEVVRYLGARPVLCDVDPETCNLDPLDLRSRLRSALKAGQRPAAIMPVHFAGVAADMEQLWDLAQEFDLAVIEDAAHAFPATYQGRPVGWMPEGIRGTVCFSFYATKTITTGEGGMVTTNDPELADRIRMMSLHGLSKQAWNRYSGGTWKYDVVAPGYKYNLTDVAAALGLVQLQRAHDMAERRTWIARRYDESLRDLPIRLPQVAGGRQSAWHLYVVRLPNEFDEDVRDQFIDELKERGVGASMHFIPLHLHSYYQKNFGYKPEDLPIALDAYRRQLSLPIWSAMTLSHIDRVIECVRDAGAVLL